jgi:hypothetical protein
MYYKIVKDSQVIDIIDNLLFIKYNTISHKIVFSNIEDAEGILSSDRKTAWHLRGLKALSAPGYDTVEAIEITKKEYHELKALNGKTPEEIIDEYTLSLIEGGLL